jgi:hypothetical protein
MGAGITLLMAQIATTPEAEAGDEIVQARVIRVGVSGRIASITKW